MTLICDIHNKYLTIISLNKLIQYFSLSLSLNSNAHKHKSIQLTKEICVQILAMSIGQALDGGALLLNSLLSSIWVDGRHDDNPGLINQLAKGNRE